MRGLDDRDCGKSEAVGSCLGFTDDARRKWVGWQPGCCLLCLFR